jgi:predicted site-specific integrase-resolvase
MNAMASMSVNDMDRDLMTRRQVAYMFGVTSSAVATWARRGRLAEMHNEAGRPRYRRADVEELFRAGFKKRPRGPEAES